MVTVDHEDNTLLCHHVETLGVVGKRLGHVNVARVYAASVLGV